MVSNVTNTRNSQINSDGSINDNRDSGDVEMHRKIDTFIQQLSDGVPLSDCITALKSHSETNGFGIDFLQRLQDFVSFTLF